MATSQPGKQTAKPTSPVAAKAQPKKKVEVKEIIPERPQPEKVAIVGFADSKVSAPYNDPSFEIWAVNEMWVDPTVQRWDVLFEIHDLDWIKEGKRDKRHYEFLKKCQKPIFMIDHYEDIPNSIKFPKDEILEYFDTTYFTNSISFEIALAIYLGFKEIHLYGVNMANDEEYAGQRPSVEFFCGWAKGAGIKLYIPTESDLLKCMYVYGYEDGELSSMAAKMKSFQEMHKARIGQFQNQINQGVAMMNQAIGADEATNYFLKAFVYPNTNFDPLKRVVKKE